MCKPITKPIDRTTKATAKKLPDSLHHRRRPATKYRNHKRYKFYRTNHANTKKLWRTVEDTTGTTGHPIGNVINLSNKAFTKETIQLLNKNLNFIPPPSIFNKTQLNKELDDFFRLIKLKAYFRDNNMYNPTTEDQLFKPKTNKKWRPDKNHHTIETYIEATKNALETEEQNNSKNKYYNNLTKGERKALKELAERNDIIITKADKGGAVVITDVEDYVKEAEHQLNNKDAYKKLQYEPTQTHTRLVNDTISRFKNDKRITENIAKGLQVQQPETPKFCTRPKIHKTGNPGHPVVSSVNCHTNTISKYVDFHLQPVVKNISSYVRDTTDSLQKLDKVKIVPNDCLLVTLDMKSVYTNIPNNEGIKAVREAYDNHPSKTVATKVIITFLSLILTLNNFVFNSINYLQIMGCAMGTICAPAYANIFMAQFEKQYIYPYI